MSDGVQDLRRLLTRAHIETSQYTLDLWFRDCTYEKGAIWCHDEMVAGLIRRCFLEQVRTVVPDCAVYVIPKVKQTAVKAYRGEAKETQEGFLS